MEQRHYRMPATGEGWRHYKGALYTIIGMAQDAAGRSTVVYTPYRWALAQLAPIYVRELGEFLEHIEQPTGGIPDIRHVPRFKFEREIGDDDICQFLPKHRSGHAA